MALLPERVRLCRLSSPRELKNRKKYQGYRPPTEIRKGHFANSSLTTASLQIDNLRLRVRVLTKNI
jgi:hypothetical protein